VLAHRLWNGASLGWAKVGVAWPPSAFLKEALQAVHPFDRADAADDDLLGKCVLLMMKMLAAIGYADSTLQHDLTYGFPIIGEAVCTGNFVAKEVPAQLTPIMLMATARTSQQSLADSMRTSAEPGLDAAVHARPCRKWSAAGWSAFSRRQRSLADLEGFGRRRGASAFCKEENSAASTTTRSSK
jgi:hypothetical protein